MVMTDRPGHKKGQAALEYFVTYGWALILVLGIIALLYAYVFKPEFYVVESCNMAPGLECNYFMLQKSLSSDEMILNLSLKSEADFAIDLQEINITATNFIEPGEKTYTWHKVGGMDVCDTNCSATVPQMYIGERGDINATFKFDLNGNPPPKPATLQRMKLSILYKINETQTSHRTAGMINVKVS